MADMKTLTLGGKTFNIMDAEARAKAIPTVQVGGDTLTWDGNTEGREVFEGVFYKVSDITPSLDDFKNGCTLTASNNTSFTLMGEEITGDAEMIIAGQFAVLFTEFNGNTPGFYLYYAEGIYIAAISIPGYTGFGEKKIDPAYLYQPDWNQNDETAPDFFKNRPFGETTKSETIVEEIEITGVEDSDGAFVAENAIPAFSADADTIKVVFDGTEYISKKNEVDGVCEYGNSALMPLGGDDTGEPYLIINIPDLATMIFLRDANKHIVSVFATVPVVNVLDEKFRPEPVLYWNVFDDSQGASVLYVYTDNICTVKATGEYVKRLVESNVGIILKMQNAYNLGEMRVGSTVGRSAITTVYTDDDFATLIISHGTKTDTAGDLVAKYRNLYTAEYPPST